MSKKVQQLLQSFWSLLKKPLKTASSIVFLVVLVVWLGVPHLLASWGSRLFVLLLTVSLVATHPDIHGWQWWPAIPWFIVGIELGYVDAKENVRWGGLFDPEFPSDYAYRVASAAIALLGIAVVIASLTTLLNAQFVSQLLWLMVYPLLVSGLMMDLVEGWLFRDDRHRKLLPHRGYIKLVEVIK